VRKDNGIPPSGSVKAGDESWSLRSNAMAFAGFAITTDDRGRDSRPVFQQMLGLPTPGRVSTKCHGFKASVLIYAGSPINVGSLLNAVVSTSVL